MFPALSLIGCGLISLLWLIRFLNLGGILPPKSSGRLSCGYSWCAERWQIEPSERTCPAGYSDRHGRSRNNA